MSNPFIAGASTRDVSYNTSNLPLLREYAWDFVHDTFRFDDTGSFIEVTENEALKVWIYKALKTERYRHEAYRHGIYDKDSNYGVELERFIGRRTNDPKNAAEIEGYIRDCLAVNPYIIRIDSIDITENKKDRLTFEITLTSIYGQATEEVNI